MSPMLPARPALVMLAASSLGLLIAALAPRPGQPVLLLLPDGEAAARAIASADWRVQRMAQWAGLTLVFAAPVGPGADPYRLGRDSGAWLAALAGLAPDCAQP